MTTRRPPLSQNTNVRALGTSVNVATAPASMRMQGWDARYSVPVIFCPETDAPAGTTNGLPLACVGTIQSAVNTRPSGRMWLAAFMSVSAASGCVAVAPCAKTGATKALST